MPQRLAALLALTLAVAPPTSAAEPGPESVEFHFDWPTAASARVTWDRSLQYPKSTRKDSPKRSTGDAVDTYTITREATLQTFRSRGTMRIEARRSGDEIAIAMRDVDSSGAPPPFEPNTTSDFVAAKREVIQVLGSDGTVARLEGTGPLREARERLLGVGVQLFGDDYFPSLERGDLKEASALWAVLVADWAGRRLPLGILVSGEATGRLPRADVTVPHRFEIRARRVPCGVSFPSRCVEIVVRREPSAEALGVAQAANNGELPAVLKPATIPQAGGAYVGTARLLTDPATLLPVHLSFDERYDIPGMDGAFFASTLEMDFAWNPPRP
jgi:hypothetical protein